MMIERVQTERLFGLVVEGVSEFEESLEVLDVFIVGSVVSGGFESGVSDVDLVVVVDGAGDGVVQGVDVLLREKYGRLLQACVPGAVGVDVGVYGDVSFVEDEEVFSCGRDCFVRDVRR